MNSDLIHILEGLDVVKMGTKKLSLVFAHKILQGLITALGTVSSISYLFVLFAFTADMTNSMIKMSKSRSEIAASLGYLALVVFYIPIMNKLFKPLYSLLNVTEERIKKTVELMKRENPEYAKIIEDTLMEYNSISRQGASIKREFDYLNRMSGFRVLNYQAFIREVLGISPSTSQYELCYNPDVNKFIRSVGGNEKVDFKETFGYIDPSAEHGYVVCTKKEYILKYTRELSKATSMVDVSILDKMEKSKKRALNSFEVNARIYEEFYDLLNKE